MRMLTGSKIFSKFLLAVLEFKIVLNSFDTELVQATSKNMICYYRANLVWMRYYLFALPTKWSGRDIVDSTTEIYYNSG